MDKQRLVDNAPVVIAVILPLVGLLLAAGRFVEKDQHQGVRLLVAAVLGGFLWALALSA